MSNVVQFTIKGIDRASPAFKSVARSAGAAAKKIKEKFRGLQTQLTSFGTAIVALGFGLLGKSFIQAASTSEQLQVRLQILLGSVKEGGRLFKEMSEFAGKVPFEFEAIMDSATTLAGVVKGGVDEITRFMPLIADLAATSGLSLRDTTGQIVRMFSAGAGAADLFRERGILAMLGFEAGVAVSAAQTKKRLIEAWEEPGSKFAGATKLLAKTWDGLLSMMSDKWFQFRNLVMDAGVFSFLKAFAATVDDVVGRSLEASKARAAAWANTIINGVKAISKAVGVMGDGFRGLQFIWIALKLAWVSVWGGILTGIDSMKRGWFNFTNAMPRAWDTTTTMLKILWENVKLGFLGAAHLMVLGWETTVNSILAGYNFLLTASPWLADKLGLETVAMVKWSATSLAAINRVKDSIADMVTAYKERTAIPDDAFVPNIEGIKTARKAVQKFAQELEALALKPMPSAVIENFMAVVQAKFLELQEATKAAAADTSEVIAETLLATTDTLAEEFANRLETFRDTQKSFNEEFSKALFATMMNTTKAVGSAFAQIIVDGKSGMELFKQIAKDALKQVIASFITMKIQRWITAKSAIGATGANTMATMSMAPFPINLSAPTVAARHMAQAAAMAATAAHGGMGFVPQETTMFLARGERVVSPRQNRDLTDFLDQRGGGGGGISIENLSIQVTTSAERFSDIDEADLEDFVGGPLIRVLNKLDDEGVRQNALERSNV